MYAMLVNIQLQYTKGFRDRFHALLQLTCCCCLAKQYTYINRSNAGICGTILLPLGWILACRRNYQFKKQGL